jgi:hypothetical protein
MAMNDEKPKPGPPPYSRGKCPNGHMRDQRAHPNAKPGEQYVEGCRTPGCNTQMRFVVAP